MADLTSGPLDMTKWQEIPCIEKRAATDEDVDNGLAVFSAQRVDGAAPVPYSMRLPHCAIYNDEESDSKIPIVIVQAEVVDSNIVVGAKMLNGGDLACPLEDVELLDEPDQRFFPE